MLTPDEIVDVVHGEIVCHYRVVRDPITKEAIYERPQVEDNNTPASS